MVLTTHTLVLTPASKSARPLDQAYQRATIKGFAKELQSPGGQSLLTPASLRKRGNEN